MIDAVPGSLMYSFFYLKSQFPELKIGSYYAGDEYDSTYDCYILPSWRSEILQAENFDLLLNIESMQEMRQDQVNFYLGLFDKLGNKNCLIYLSNARDYVFLGDWHIPNHWQTLYLNNTPRSWSADHPTHILLKREKSSSWNDQRNAHENSFKNQIMNWNNSEFIRELQAHLLDRDRICGELKSQLQDLTSNASYDDNLNALKRIDAIKFLIKRGVRKLISLTH
jgi:hypothetical protein